MSGTVNVNLLISDIANGKQYTHCRLCLKTIEDYYVRFGDGVAVDAETEEQHLQPLSDLITKLLGPEVSEEVPAMEAVCTDCVEQALGAFKFIENCHRSTKILHNILDNLLQTLDVTLEASDDHSLYVLVDESNSELILMKNDTQPTIKSSDSTLESKVSCLECADKFTSLDDYKHHCLQNHNLFLCESCNDTFLTIQELSNHPCVATYKCKKCNQFKSTEEALMEHHIRAHQLHVCKECGKSCHGSDKLKYHENKHSNKSECPKCGKTYTTKDFYLKHVKLCTEGLLDPHPFRTSLKRNFSCKECGKSYSTSGGLRVHNRFEHGDSKPHVCPHCNKKFTAPSYLKVHMITHTKEKNFACNVCGNRFVSKEALLYHTRRHTGEKPYKCELCLERFVNASARAEHIKHKHIGPTLMCEICSRKFVTPHFLRMHIKRHKKKEQQAWCLGGVVHDVRKKKSKISTPPRNTTTLPT